MVALNLSMMNRKKYFLVIGIFFLLFLVTLINFGYLSDAILGVVVDSAIIIYSAIFLLNNRKKDSA